MNESNTLERRQRFAEDLAIDAGKLAQQYFLFPEELEIETKNPRDFVSEADRSVERMIRKQILTAYPDDNIVGEEGGGIESDAYWCLDPIDGTSNFLAGIPMWGVSIGYCENGLPTVGAVSIPMLDILVSANILTHGIRFNREAKLDRKTSIVPTMVLGQSPNWETDSYREVDDIFRTAGLECMNYRCSVVGMIFAALGLTHGYYEEHTNIWDVAAGYVVALQAGLRAEINRNEADNILTISVLTKEIDHLVGNSFAARHSKNEQVNGV